MKAIVLTRGRIATVDDSDFDRVNQFTWSAAKRGDRYYGVRNLRLPDGSWTMEYLHNFILGVKGVDHQDGDGLNCLRLNLRPATKLQNSRAFRRKQANSSSEYRGVYWRRNRSRWIAQIHVNKRHIVLGQFEVEEDAARAYDVAAEKYFGNFAAPNFI